MDDLLRKRKRNFESDPDAPLRGSDFTSGIRDLAYGGATGVLGGLKIPYKEKYTTTFVKKASEVTDTDKSIEDYGTFNITHHRDDGGFWRQGLLTPMGKTSYFDKGGVDDKAIPATLTAKRALVESRAMKFLSLSAEDYKPKEGDINVAVTEQRLPKNKKTVTKSDQDVDYWGGLTMGSFLEDITGSRSLGIHDAGSGMRAMTMASKWRMKTTGAMNEANFGTKMLQAFPQLGKQDMEKDIIPGLGTHKTGASALRQQIVGSDSAKKIAVIKHHIGMRGSVLAAHHEAEQEAGKRFDDKFAQAKSAIPGTDLTPTLGKWWEAQRKKGTDFATLADPSALRKGYVDNKLKRHGIERYPDLSQLETIKALKTTDKAEYTKQKRLFLKANLQGSPHLQEMQERWAAKNSFKTKVDGLLVSGTPPTKKWWKDKGTAADFKVLSTSKMKTLSKEYANHRVEKLAERRLAAGQKFDDKLAGHIHGTLIKPFKAKGWWDTQGGTHDLKSLSDTNRAKLRSDYIVKKVPPVTG